MNSWPAGLRASSSETLVTVERFDGARDSERGSARGDGLARVTYLFGGPASSNPTAADLPGAEPGAGTELPTLASVFGELDSEIEAQLVARRASAVAESQGVTGDPTASDAVARQDAASEKAKARAERVSMQALTRRGMSKREVERSLRARELDDETVASELERLEGVGLIDDMALAQNLVGTLQERKGLGRSAIAAELTRRLLTPVAIEYALDLIEIGDELGRARDIAVKRAAQLRSYDRETAVRRLSAFLMRRGYSGSTIRAAVDHALPSTPGSSVRFR